MQMEITHTINHSQYELHKYSGVSWKQNSLSKSLKEQKRQDNSSFYCKRVQQMPLRTLPETVVYQGQVNKG